MSDLTLALSYLVAQSTVSIFHVFWYTIVFDMPRYLAGFVALAIGGAVAKAEANQERDQTWIGRISVLVVGYNEADSLERCLRSLREQSIDNLEVIVVSDGSTDDMHATARQMVARGLADEALVTNLRAGKAAGQNLAMTVCSGDIIFVVDCDCSYDRFAFEEMMKPFADPAVGAVVGDIVPRNGHTSLTARFQSIEYLITISLGKRVSHAIGQISCVSGAFGAFRREALFEVGGCDVGGGEDLDLTIRLRQAGWRIAFAKNAICYTDVPHQFYGLVRQRLRWERDAVRIRFRKHVGLIDPMSGRFNIGDVFHQLEFLLFSVVAAFVFPIYTVWLFTTYGSFAIAILLAMQIGLLLVDVVTLLLAAVITGRPVFFQNLPYLPGYAVFNGYAMRSVRLWAYIEEWLLFASTHDNYVPEKVRGARKW